jgi:hypothetical protein
MSSPELQTFVGELETALLEHLDAETDRVKSERDFLLAVYNGRTDGATTEDASTGFVMRYLTGMFNGYVLVERDVSAPSS